MKNMKKSLVLLLAVLMVVSLVVGATIAWLTDTTEEVKNTFTTSGISITLEETPTNLDEDENNNTNSYQMIPGYTLAKDPYVTVSADSENCYLFVEIIESENFGTYLSYEIADGWKTLSGVDGVYYKEIDTPAEKGVDEEGNPVKHYVLKGNQVVVDEEVTNEQMAALNATGAKLPTLSFKAYAIQYMKNNTENFEPAEAWAKINPPANP